MVSVLIASVIEPIASRLQRYRIPRALSVLCVYLIVSAVIGVVATILVPPLVAEVQDLAAELPGTYNHLQGLLGRAGDVLGMPSIVTSLQDALVNLGNLLARSAGGFFQTTRSVFGGIVAVILTFVISFYLVVSRNSFVSFLRSIVPPAHQPYIVNLVQRAQEKIGRWVLAQMILGAIVGVVVFLGLWSLGVPYALALALLAGFLEVVPVLGPILAAIPAVLIGFTQSPLLGALVLVLYVVVQQLENHILVPNVMRRAIGLNPLATILAVLIGAKLAGFLGILLAVPVATVVALFIGDLIPAGQESEEGAA